MIFRKVYIFLLVTFIIVMYFRFHFYARSLLIMNEIMKVKLVFFLPLLPVFLYSTHTHTHSRLRILSLSAQRDLSLNPILPY